MRRQWASALLTASFRRMVSGDVFSSRSRWLSSSGVWSNATRSTHLNGRGRLRLDGSSDGLSWLLARHTEEKVLVRVTLRDLLVDEVHKRPAGPYAVSVGLSREALERLAGCHPAKPDDVALNERLHRCLLDAPRVSIGSIEEETVAQRQSIHTTNVPASAKVDEPSQREEAEAEVSQRDGSGVAKAWQRVRESVVRRQFRHAGGCPLRARQ
eukprot:6300731-Prymnesium_polylepis.3